VIDRVPLIHQQGTMGIKPIPNKVIFKKAQFIQEKVAINNQFPL
jgi:hypothetical protein